MGCSSWLYGFLRVAQMSLRQRHWRTAVDGAAECGRFDMVQLLLNAYPEGVDLEPIRWQAADYAEKKGHIELAKWLRGGCAG